MKTIFPTVLQNSHTECGIACIASILRGFGYYSSLADLHQHFPTQGGTTGGDMCRLLNVYNITSSPVIFEDVRDLKPPCILHWQGIHYVLLTKIKRNSIEIMDPSSGKMELPISYSKVYLETRFAIEVKKSDSFIKKVAPESIISVGSIMKFFMSHKKAFFSTVFIGAVAKIFLLSMPYYAHLIIDEVIGKFDYDLLVLLLVVFLGSSIFGGITNYIFNRESIALKNSFNLEASVSIVKEIMCKKIGFFKTKVPSDIVSRIRETDQIFGAVFDFSINIIPEGLVILISCIAMYLYAPALMLIVIAIAGVSAVISWIFANSIAKKQHRAIKAKVEEEAHIIDVCTNAELIKSFSLGWSSIETFRKKRSEFIASHFSLEISETKISLFFQGLQQIQNVGILAAAVYLYFKNPETQSTITVGGLFAFVFIKNMFFQAIEKIFMFIITIRGYRSALWRLDEVLREAKEKEGFNETFLDRKLFYQDINIINYSFKWSEFSKDFTFKDVNITIPYGKKIAIMGSSGAGKSTLLKLISRLYESDTNNIRLGDTPTKDIPLTFYRENICYLPLNEMLDQSIYENISLGKDASIEDTLSILKKLDILSIVTNSKMGLNMFVKRADVSISSGELQRLTVAKMLLSEAPVKLLDEPTAFLDNESKHKVMELITNMPSTIICALHDRELALKYFDCHYHICDGRLIEGLPGSEV
jgi:ABC-type bacteriocin/lantibiotic exporter with double-glycine peptidase domain